jgi:putative endonuclease
MPRQYFVYVLTNTYHSVLYTGVTNDLLGRVWRHRAGVGGKFTAKYACNKLVFYEVYLDPYNAIAREKQIKAGSRHRKIALIELMNPAWVDLYDHLQP